MCAAIVCRAWLHQPKNSLQGFVTIELTAFGLLIHDVAIHRSGGSVWAQLPARPWLQNNALVTKEGKIQYAPIFQFNDKDLGSLFSQHVVAALAQAYPNNGVVTFAPETE